MNWINDIIFFLSFIVFVIVFNKIKIIGIMIGEKDKNVEGKLDLL